jgi:thioredoxin reductase
VENGILVDAYLETSTKGIFAAGDVARTRIRRPARDADRALVVAERQARPYCSDRPA